jgi:hypothetical protein
MYDEVADYAELEAIPPCRIEILILYKILLSG